MSPDFGRYKPVWLLLLAALAACSTPATTTVTEIITNEVTRVVEVPVTPIATAAAPIEIEVTRLVEVTPVPSATEPPPPAPLQFWTAPGAAAELSAAQQEVIADTVLEVTGREVAAHFAGEDDEVVAALCSDPANVAAILPPLHAYEALSRCGGQPVLAARRFEQTWHADMIVVRFDSGLSTVTALDGRVGGVAESAGEVSLGALAVRLNEAGATPERLERYDSEAAALLALFAGEVDFALATYIPPILPFEERDWILGEDDPEAWRSFVAFVPDRSPRGYILVAGEPRFGGWRVRDARAALFDVQPQIFNETRIVDLTVPIPNDALVLGGGMPLAEAAALVQAFEAYAAGDECGQSLCSRDFYDWPSLTPIDSRAFAPLADVVAAEVPAP